MEKSFNSLHCGGVKCFQRNVWLIFSNRLSLVKTIMRLLTLNSILFIKQQMFRKRLSLSLSHWYDYYQFAKKQQPQFLISNCGVESKMDKMMKKKNHCLRFFLLHFSEKLSNGTGNRKISVFIKIKLFLTNYKIPWKSSKPINAHDYQLLN